MIVKMTILRLLGSSNDKEIEKIGVARPKGPSLRGFIHFLIVSKSMCIHFLGDSNTKCTHLGGVHPIICDFETNIFSTLSFVVSY